MLQSSNKTKCTLKLYKFYLENCTLVIFSKVPVLYYLNSGNFHLYQFQTFSIHE